MYSQTYTRCKFFFSCAHYEECKTECNCVPDCYERKDGFERIVHPTEERKRLGEYKSKDLNS